MNLTSIRFKMSVLYTGILCIILCVFSAILLLAVQRILYRDIDEELHLKAVEIINHINAYNHIEESKSRPLIYVAENKLFVHLENERQASTQVLNKLWEAEAEVLKLKRDYVHIISEDGKIVLKSESSKAEIGDLLIKRIDSPFSGSQYGNLSGPSSRMRFINEPFVYKDKFHYAVQIATSLSSVDKVLYDLGFFCGLSILAILVLTSFMGRFFAVRILSPVKKITNLANRISHAELNMRIRDNPADEEMRYLIQSFNTMIERLEKSFLHISEFSSYVAHELKTPLAIVRGEIELALHEGTPEDEYRRVLEVNLQEIDRLIKTINDILLLTKLDYKTEIFKSADIRFNEFLDEIAEHGRILGMEKKIKVSYRPLESGVVVYGDRLHLRRLFLNILSNAIKFTPAGGTIELSPAIENKYVKISVKDSGVGISEENIPKVFDKFFRVQDGRFEPASGNGLGLSIAMSIAKFHGGRIEVSSRLGEGSTFTVILPVKQSTS